MSSLDGASVVSEGPTTRKYRFKTSMYLLGAGYIGLLGLVLFVIAFFSPYWLASHKYAYSSFVRLGLWSFCFDHYKHPPYQYDETFTGCEWIYSQRYHNIRDWLQPGWFIFVQSMITTSTLFSILGLFVTSVPIMHFAIRYNVVIIIVASILQAISALCGVLACLVFAIKHDDRSWLMNPRLNHLDWAFYIAVWATLFAIVTTILLVLESRKAYDRKQRFTNLVYNMHPRPGYNGFETVPLKPVKTIPKYDENMSTHSSPYTTISRFSAPQTDPRGYRGGVRVLPPTTRHQPPPPQLQSQHSIV